MSKTTFVSSHPRPLEDFIALTGLKNVYAKGCFDRFGGYAPALASFAQSYALLPEDYFEDRKKAEENADAINKELRLIYQRARLLKTQLGKEDEGVWAAYYANSSSSPEPKQELSNVFKLGTSSTPSKSNFTFENTKNAAPASITTHNFGFGTVSASSTSMNSSAPAAFAGFAQPAQTTKTTGESSSAKEVKYCKPSHFTGPFFDMPLFWKEEVENACPLLNLNKGFLERNHSDLRKKLLKWVEKAAFFKQPVQYVEIGDEDEETVRVIIKDADRTFFHPEHRKKFVAFLCAMRQEFKAYGQAMSYLAGLCMLVLSEEETAAVLRFVEKTYIPGHWAAEAVGFASSAWVVEWFMQQEFPDVAKHLEELKFWPDTYLQKILTGLCIHVLDFDNLFEFLDCFMEGGMRYLIRFSLAVVERFRTDLLSVASAMDANKVYEIMRLDSRVADASDVKTILQRAKLMDLGKDGDSIDVIRSQVYDAHVAPRLARAPKTEAFEPCNVCNERRPTWWNDDIGAVCTECKEKDSTLDYTKY